MKKIVVTGASSGIGLKICEELLSQGNYCFGISRRKEPLENLEKKYSSLFSYCNVDFNLPQEAVNTLKVDIKEWLQGNGLDAIINNAGTYVPKKIEEANFDNYQAMWNVNFLTHALLTQSLLDDLKRKKGVIINIASTLGQRPIQFAAAYSASKAAMISWTQSLALELAPFQVRANVICPGIVGTEIHQGFVKDKKEWENTLANAQPLGRVGKPEDIAHLVHSLIDERASWMTGSSIVVDGGISLI